MRTAARQSSRLVKMMLGSPTSLVAALLALGLTSPAQGQAWAQTAAPYPATTFAECQKKTANPLQGCPDGTIFVSLNDTAAQFTSVQSAILSIPNNSVPYYILIGAGNYTEQLNVTRSGPLYLLGQSNLPSQGKTYAADVSYNKTAQNDVQIWWNSANIGGDEFSDNVYTGVLTVGPTLDATLTGSGTTGFAVPDDTPFGTRDFRVYNIDFRNEEFPYTNGPALALGVSRANAGFYSCGFYSWQDTVRLLHPPVRFARDLPRYERR